MIDKDRANGEHVEMETLFGEEKVVSGKVLEVDFFTSKIILEKHHASTIKSSSNKGDEA